MTNEIEKEIDIICKKVLDYMNEEDYCHLTNEKYVEEQLKENIKDLFKAGKSQSQNHSQQNKTLQNSKSGNRKSPVLVYTNAVFSVKDKTADAQILAEKEIEEIEDRLDILLTENDNKNYFRRGHSFIREIEDIINSLEKVRKELVFK